MLEVAVVVTGMAGAYVLGHWSGWRSAMRVADVYREAGDRWFESSQFYLRAWLATGAALAPKEKGDG